MLQGQVGGDVDRVGAQTFVDGVRGGVHRADERRDLEGGVGGQHAPRPQPVEGQQHALVGHQQAAHAEFGRAHGVLDAPGERVVAAGAQPRAAREGAGPGAGVPGAARAGEQAQLDVVFGAGPDHLGDLGVAQHPHTAALADAVDGDAEGLGLLQHGGQCLRPLHGGDLGAPGAAVGEGVRGRVGGVQGRDGVAEGGEGGLAGAAAGGRAGQWSGRVGHDAPRFGVSYVVGE